MKTIRTLAVLSFMAMLGLGVASCFNPSGPGGSGSGDTVRHGRLPIDTVRDTTRHHHHHFGEDTLIGNDTLIHRDTLPPPPPPDSGGLDSTMLDSLLGHH